MNRKERRAARSQGRPAGSSPQIEAQFAAALAHHQAGRLAEAERLYKQICALDPNHVDSLHFLGVLAGQVGRHDIAIELIGRALALDPDYVDALNNRGNALRELKRPAEALASYDRALAIDARRADVLNNRGNALCDLKRPADGLLSYERALALDPRHVKALNNRGVALAGLKRPAAALASYDKALAILPDYVDALNNRGNALGELHRHAEALASYDKALALAPAYADALNNRGTALRELGRPAEALESFERALALQPGFADALSNRGTALRELNRPQEALASFERALAIEPDHGHAFEGMADAALAICDWRRTAMVGRELEPRIRERGSVINPFGLLGYGSDSSLQLECARRYVAEKLPPPAPPPSRQAARHHDELRIAYLSADFHRHATAFLTADLFERHDRGRFEIIAISFGPDDHSDMRARLVRAFDQFHDVGSKSDSEVAKLMSELQVDIAVDLKGHTRHARLGILAHRPAPVQAAYLGYPGTTGAGFIDYVIADPTVLPFDQQPFYTERIVHLPQCYQVSALERSIAARAPTRPEAGLPAKGFVFCCFNNNYKITEPVFDVWMRLLGAVAGSVLWLLQDNDGAQASLRQAAAARGIDPARLVFAGRLAAEEHLARHRLADLFVDTLPYNAHTTASDALWAGLPVLTCEGASFPGRVAASLLAAAGLPDLVTGSLGEYEALGLRLARDPALLRAVRDRLAQNRSVCALFDADRFRRHIETAYTKMQEIALRGESPRSFSVEP
jgi:protein O-GlcNAc transferase